MLTRHAFTWTASGGMVDLGTLPGGASSQGQKSTLRERSPEKLSIPTGSKSPLLVGEHGFVSLGESQGDSRNYGWSINDSGVMTGQIYTGEVVNAFNWRLGARPRFIPALPNGLHMVGVDINNRNHITGEGSVPTGWEAFVWSQARGTVGIGSVPGASVTLGHGINDNDEVTGIGYFSSSTTALYWSRPTGIVVMQTLGGVTGAGLDINLAGGIVAGAPSPRERLMPQAGLTTPACRRTSAPFPAAPSVMPIALTAQDKSPATRRSPDSGRTLWSTKEEGQRFGGGNFPS